MIYGIGADIVAFERFQRFIDKENTALLKRLFSEQERERCEARKDSAACYAARFAAKEAFLKALGSGMRDGLSWLDMARRWSERSTSIVRPCFKVPRPR